MSLLLEALKKAERAKEEAQRRAAAEAGRRAEPDVPGGRLETRQRPATSCRDIRQALAARRLRRAAGQAARRRSSAEPAAAPSQPAGADWPRARDGRRKVFEAKFSEPNPRLPFYITMGALGVFAVRAPWLLLVSSCGRRRAGQPQPASPCGAKRRSQRRPLQWSRRRARRHSRAARGGRSPGCRPRRQPDRRRPRPLLPPVPPHTGGERLSGDSSRRAGNAARRSASRAPIGIAAHRRA